MKNTIHDIAKRAGVSSATVSRVFNNHPYVKADIRRRVLEAARLMNYQPKATARRDTISIVVSGTSVMLPGVYERNLVSSLLTVAENLNMNLEFVTVKNIERVFQNFSKAVVGMVYNERDIAVLRSLTDIPVMTVNYITPGCSYVCTNHEGDLHDATEYLIRRGHKRIAILFQPFTSHFSWGDKARLNGYRRALRENGIPFRSELTVSGFQEAPDRFQRLLEREAPDALLACGESMVLPVLHKLALSGRKVPDDLSLISYYSPGITPFLLPEPTFIRQDFDSLARSVMETMRALILGETDHVEVLLKNHFVEGRSVKERAS